MRHLGKCVLFEATCGCFSEKHHNVDENHLKLSYSAHRVFEVRTSAVAMQHAAVPSRGLGKKESYEMAEGTVKWFKNTYGFIAQEGGEDLFVHFSEIITENPDDYKTLNEGDRVEFEITQGDRGKLKASNVRKIG